MLERLLQILARKEIATMEDLAQHLGISHDLLEQMLQDLSRGGYVELVEMACDRRCAGCSESPICALVQGKRVWRVTEKGFRLAARQEPPSGAA
jgi:predicted ArsR family transcriptional regulator